jgi:hypothetical protein
MKVLSQTVDTGAKTSFLLSYGAADGDDDSNLFLTAMYELKLNNMQSGTQKAKDIETNVWTSPCPSLLHFRRRSPESSNLVNGKVISAHSNSPQLLILQPDSILTCRSTRPWHGTHVKMQSRIFGHGRCKGSWQRGQQRTSSQCDFYKFCELACTSNESYSQPRNSSCSCVILKRFFGLPCCKVG